LITILTKDTYNFIYIQKLHVVFINFLGKIFQTVVCHHKVCKNIKITVNCKTHDICTLMQSCNFLLRRNL